MGGYPPMAPTDPDVLTLEHPVPQVTPSLRRRHDAAANPSLAIRWRFGDTKREFNASQVFLANDVVTRCLASHPPGPCGSSSPASSVISRHCDFLPPIAPRFVAFAWRYLGRTRLSSLLGGRVRRRGLELVTRYLRPGISEETTGSPKFLGNLSCPFAHVLADAGRTARTRPLRCSSVAPGPPGAKAPTKGLSTPNSMAFGLAVYASQGGLLRSRARLASGCWSSSTGWAFRPQDSNERFQDCFLHLYSPLPSFAWRDGGDRRRLRVGSMALPRSFTKPRFVNCHAAWRNREPFCTATT